jgi:hypothetical protein
MSAENLKTEEEFAKDLLKYLRDEYLNDVMREAIEEGSALNPNHFAVCQAFADVEECLGKFAYIVRQFKALKDEVTSAVDDAVDIG